MTLTTLIEQVKAADAKATPSTWGVERTSDTNWIGPMRKSGDGKISIIVVSTEREDLKASALKRNDADADLIALYRNVTPALVEMLEEAVKALVHVNDFASPTFSHKAGEVLDRINAMAAKISNA